MPVGGCGWVSLFFDMAWTKQHSKNKSCNVSTIVTNRSGKTRSLFGRRPFALLCSLVFFWVGSSSVRADSITQADAQRIADAIADQMYALLTQMPISFAPASGVITQPLSSPTGMPLGIYLAQVLGWDAEGNSAPPAKSIVQLLEDISSSSFSSTDLENLFDNFFTSQSVSLGNLARPQYEFFRDLMLQGDDVGYKVYTFFEARPDWLDFFESVYEASLKTYDFGVEYPRLIESLGDNEDAWRAVLATETVDAFENMKNDIVDAVDNQQESFIDISSALGSMTNSFSDLNANLGDLAQTVTDWRQDFLDYVSEVTDTEKFHDDAVNAAQQTNNQVVQAQNDAQQALDNEAYQAQEAMSEDKDPSFTSDIVPNPYDPMQGLYDQVTSKVGDRIPSASDYNFSPKMTLLYENKEVWGRGVNKIEIDLSKPHEWAPGIGSDFNQKITTVMRWFWELVVNVSTIAIVLRYIGKIHENMV